ncbi:MAG: glycosyltransferase family 2 protein [Patescibacteria group bacterium]|jgi:hypothetical protein
MTSPADQSLLISVVMLNYNGLAYLQQTIPPLLQLDYTQYEILVVDNHSTDESINFLRSASRRDPRLRLVEYQENTGYGRGKNLGVAKAKGEYILLLDEDILIETPTLLSELIQLYQRLSNPGFISLLMKEQTDQTKTKLYGGFISLFSVYANRPLSIDALSKQEFHPASSPDGGAIFFKKSTFTTLGGYDVSQPYYLDVGDLGLRAAIYGYRTYVYNKQILCHLGTARKTNKAGWLWKYGYHFSGLSRVMFKNYRLVNLLIAYPYFCLICIMKTALNMLRYRDWHVVSRFMFSVGYFFNNYKSLIKERRRIQTERTLPDDVFLKIKRPI